MTTFVFAFKCGEMDLFVPVLVSQSSAAFRAEREKRHTRRLFFHITVWFGDSSLRCDRRKKCPKGTIRSNDSNSLPDEIKEEDKGGVEAP